MPALNQAYKPFPNIPTMPTQQPQAPVYEVPRVSQQLTDVAEEPAHKRQKTEEQLMPEAAFLGMHPGPVRFSVQIPNMPDKPEWNLMGQLILFTMPLTETVKITLCLFWGMTKRQKMSLKFLTETEIFFSFFQYFSKLLKF